MSDCVEAVVLEIDFILTKDKNLIPEITLDPKVEYFCPNLYTLQLSGIRVGDTVRICPEDKKLVVVKKLRPVDSTPPLLPHTCPECGYELTFILDRHLCVKCPNISRCGLPYRDPQEV